jgi:CheY-like chemotaxis protein
VGKGTGLGLATVFGIVRQNMGFINVYSEPGQGTTFRIYLPQIVVDDTAEQASDAEEEAPKGAGTIFLVEDEEQVRVVTQKMLEGLGYTVIVAADPKEALHLCQGMTAAPDLLLTDVIMPEMSGRELCDTLTAQWPGLRTVFMSGYTADLLKPHHILTTDTLFLQKPFIRKELARKVKEAMIGTDRL